MSDGEAYKRRGARGNYLLPPLSTGLNLTRQKTNRQTDHVVQKCVIV